MDYDDDDDQYRQYEDEMYKDASEEGEDSDEIESDVEANLLGHIHYSSDLSKTLGMQNGTKNDTNGSPTPSSEHLADPVAPAENYFKPRTHSTEQENGTEQASRPLSTKHQLDDEDDGEEESRYSVTKKRDSKNTSAQAPPLEEVLSDGSDADSVADFEDEEEEYEGSDDGDDVVEDKQEIQEHVIDLASLMNGTAPEVGDAPATDLSHLEDEKFKDCPTVWREYEYLSEKPANSSVVAYCYNCADVGHFGDYAQRVTSAFSSRNIKNPSSRSDRDEYRSNDYSNDRDRRRDYDRYDRDRDYDRRSDDKRSRDRDRDRERERDRDRDRDRDRERRQEKAGDKYGSRNRDRDREPENDRSHDDYRSRNSTSQSTSHNAPTTATGGTVYTHPLPARPSPRPNNSRPSSRPTSRRNSPERISRPEGGRMSFAEQNAFPRGGGGSDGLIGAVRQSDRNGPSPGPMYTGGYSRTSIDPRARN
ncbi:hypothetical protein BG000_008847 [Podila horticola]|nr:hypothetical protein BG000_008847 [Podila horticola]